MSKFKVGDWVQLKPDSPLKARGGYVYAIQRLNRPCKITSVNQREGYLRFNGDHSGWFHDNFELLKVVLMNENDYL